MLDKMLKINKKQKTSISTTLKAIQRVKIILKTDDKIFFQVEGLPKNEITGNMVTVKQNFVRNDMF